MLWLQLVFWHILKKRIGQRIDCVGVGGQRKSKKHMRILGCLYFVPQSELQLKQRLPLGLIGQRCSLCDAAPVCSACCGLLFVQQARCLVSLRFPSGGYQGEPGRSREADTQSLFAVLNLQQRKTASYAIADMSLGYLAGQQNRSSKSMQVLHVIPVLSIYSCCFA